MLAMLTVIIISVIDTKQDVVIKIHRKQSPLQELPFGVAPMLLFLDPTGKLLYVANGANNLLAVIDLETDKVTD